MNNYAHYEAEMLQARLDESADRFFDFCKKYELDIDGAYPDLEFGYHGEVEFLSFLLDGFGGRKDAGVLLKGITYLTYLLKDWDWDMELLAELRDAMRDAHNDYEILYLSENIHAITPPDDGRTAPGRNGAGIFQPVAESQYIKHTGGLHHENHLHLQQHDH